MMNKKYNKINGGVVNMNNLKNSNEYNWLIVDENDIREEYEKANPKDYYGEIIIANQINCFLKSSKKESKSGNMYNSNMNILKLYIDSDETQITFFDEMFNNYDKTNDILTVRGKNPLLKLIQFVLNKPDKNKFKIKYHEFQNFLNSINKIKVQITTYTENEYENYSFEVLEISQKQ